MNECAAQQSSAHHSTASTRTHAQHRDTQGTNTLKHPVVVALVRVLTCESRAFRDSDGMADSKRQGHNWRDYTTDSPLAALLEGVAGRPTAATECEGVADDGEFISEYVFSSSLYRFPYGLLILVSGHVVVSSSSPLLSWSCSSSCFLDKDAQTTQVLTHNASERALQGVCHDQITFSSVTVKKSLTAPHRL